MSNRVRKLISDYLALLGANAVAVAFSFGNTLLLTRGLGPQGYGQWSVFLAVVNGLVLMATNWSMIGLVRFGCEEYVLDRAIRRAFWARSVLLAASFAVVLVGAYPLGLWLRPHLPDLAKGQWLVIGAAAACALSLHAQHAFQAVEKMKRVGYVQIAERAILLGGILLLMAGGMFSLRRAMGVYIAGGLLAGLSLLTLKRTLWLPPRFDADAFRGLLSFSTPYLILYPFGFLTSGYLDVLILANYVPCGDVGGYYLAVQLAGLLTQVSTVACIVLIPVLTRAAVQKRHDVIEQYLQRLLPHIIFLWSAVLAVALVVGEYVLPWVFGDKFLPAVAPFQILLLGCGFAGITQFAYAPLINACKWTWLNMFVNVAAGIANLGFDLLLIPRWGTGGCALATVLAYATTAFLMVKCTRRRLALPSGLSIFLACAPLFASLGAIAYLHRPWLGGAGFLAACCLVVWYFRLFGVADRQLLREMS